MTKREFERRQTIEDVLCIADEEKESMRAALLAQISEVALPEGDSDDEGDGTDAQRDSSDDGSDDDTVENVVLPKRCVSIMMKLSSKSFPPILAWNIHECQRAHLHHTHGQSGEKS